MSYNRRKKIAIKISLSYSLEARQFSKNINGKLIAKARRMFSIPAFQFATA